MSIEVNWDALVGGSDGLALAETIRAFIHDKFQQVPLPRFIRSVKIHSFDFGSVAPEFEIKDVCDPLSDFYDDDTSEDAAQPSEREPETEHHETVLRSGNPHDARPDRKHTHSPRLTDRKRHHTSRLHRPSVDTNVSNFAFMRSAMGTPNPFLQRSSTPGIPGGTANMGYFHLPLSAGISGTATPLATAVGAQFGTGWADNFHPSTHDAPGDQSPSASRRTSFTSQRSVSSSSDDHLSLNDLHNTAHDKSVEDIQIVMRLKYSGDVKLSVTADILLDYPMPSFVGIPLRLVVTGLTFDGVAILAYIKNKAHFCFLAPEDADALVGRDAAAEMHGTRPSNDTQQQEKRVGALFEEIKVESEIGQKMSGKQVLKNVGKVEKFVLEQVRQIFENEFVYPSFWTFLV